VLVVPVVFRLSWVMLRGLTAPSITTSIPITWAFAAPWETPAVFWVTVQEVYVIAVRLNE
jgi:hypothetical protein